MSDHFQMFPIPWRSGIGHEYPIKRSVLLPETSETYSHRHYHSYSYSYFSFFLSFSLFLSLALALLIVFASLFVLQRRSASNMFLFSINYFINNCVICVCGVL